MIIKASPVKDNFASVAFSDGKYILYKKGKDKSLFRVTDSGFNVLNSFELGPVNRDNRVFAAENCPLMGIVSDGKSLTVYDLEGKALKSIGGSYIMAGFDSTGNLWCIKRIDKENLSIELYDADFSLSASLDIEDELYESSAELRYISGLGCMLLELAAGQDGCQAYLLKGGGKSLEIVYTFESDLTCITFNADHSRFLAIMHGEDGYGYYTYPGGEEISSMFIEETVGEDADNGGGALYFNL